MHAKCCAANVPQCECTTRKTIRRVENFPRCTTASSDVTGSARPESLGLGLKPLAWARQDVEPEPPGRAQGSVQAGLGLKPKAF